MGLCLHLSDPKARDPSLVGHKCANLALALESGFPVPKAIAVTTLAHRAFLRSNTWPEGLQDCLFTMLSDLDLAAGVSVRSSGSMEDLADRSFAGQYSTILDVRDQQALLQALLVCWQSATSTQVQSYQQKDYQVANDPFLMGIVVQQMVQARYAGVAFSRNPLYPARQECVVEAVAGLGQHLVNGQTSPHRAYVQGPNDVYLEAPAGRPPKLELKRADWLAIAGMAKELEDRYKHPQDIEWAQDLSGRLWLLQTRPISTISPDVLQLPAGIWTRKIANDLWSDRLTPFLASEMEDNAPRFDLSRAANWLGLPVSDPTLKVIDGYLYVNVTRLPEILGLIPRGLNLSSLDSLLPASQRDIPRKGHWTKSLSIACRGLVFFLFNPWANPLTCGLANRWHRLLMAHRLRKLGRQAVRSSSDCLRAIDQDLGLLACNQQRNQWPYTYATLSTWTLQWLLGDKLRLPQGVFLDLLAQKGDNVTLRIERELRSLAKSIAHNPDLLKRIQDEPLSRLRFSLPLWLQQELAEFMKCYGCRSPMRTLTAPRWEEEPQQVLAFLRSLSSRRTRSNAPAAENRTAALKQIPALWRPLIWGLGLVNRYFLDLREELRFILDRNLCLLRQHLVRLGKQTKLDQGVFFLTRSELKEVVSGRLDWDQAKALSTRRAESHGEHRQPWIYYVDGRGEQEFEPRKGELRGIGTSSGQVAGIAQVISDPTQARLNKEVIIVARHTDPGWTPLMGMIKGIIVEEGGLLSHCAIVAREFGIPAVVGVLQATQRITDGMSICLDGAAGIVWLEPDQGWEIP